MATVKPRAPLQPGERAPDFALPAVDREEQGVLADYRGKHPLLLAIERLAGGSETPGHRAPAPDFRLAVDRSRSTEWGVPSLGRAAADRIDPDAAADGY